MLLRPLHRVKKRFFVVTALTIVVVALVGGLLAFFIASLPGPADMTRWVVEERPTRQNVFGSGLSLSQMDKANWLLDPSFEPFHFRTALKVQDGDRQTVRVSANEIGDPRYDEGFFAGARVRVLGWDEQGFSLKKTARAQTFGVNRVGSFQPINLPGDFPAQTVILDFAQSEDLTLAAATQGMLLYQAASTAPQTIDLDLAGDMTGITSYADGFFVCSSRGDVLHSTNGMDWQTLHSPQPLSLNAIAASDDGRFAAVGQNGRIISGYAAESDAALTLEATSHFNTVTYGSDLFLAAGEGGSILTSQGGMIWSSLPSPEVNWYRAGHLDGRFVLAGEGGMLGISDDGRHFDWIETGYEQDFIDLIMLSRQHFILLDRSGQFFVSHDGGQQLIASDLETGMESQVISLVGRDKILSADRQGQLGIASLMTEIRLDSPLREGSFQAGDVVFLEKTWLEFPESFRRDLDDLQDSQEAWQVFGPGQASRQQDDAAPGGGMASLRIDRSFAAPQEPTIVSQVLPQDTLGRANRSEILRAELWMRQEQADSGEVKVWLSGLTEPIGTTYQHVGTQWRKFTFTFVMPSGHPLETEAARLNIAYNGSSPLWLDRVYLGHATEDETAASSAQTETIQKMTPRAIRMDFLEMGAPYSGMESWTMPLGNESLPIARQDWRQSRSHSLHAALQLAHEAGADPWLVFDSLISENELIHLMEYLAGPITEPYGRQRQHNGQIMPWTERFERIYIEFTDHNQLFDMDRFRGDHVNFLIDAINRSPHYQQVKQQIVFVDGLHYDEGVMLSSADYHAGDLYGTFGSDPAENVSQAYQTYYSQIPRIPDKPGQHMISMIRSFLLSRDEETDQAVTLADWTRFLLEDLGEQTAMTLLQWPQESDFDPEGYGTAVEIVSQAAQGSRLAIEPLALTEEEPLQQAVAGADMLAYGFMDSQQIAIVLINPSDSRQDGSLVTDLALAGASLIKYDAQGNELDRQTYRQTTQTITLLPGGVALLRQPLTPPD